MGRKLFVLVVSLGVFTLFALPVGARRVFCAADPLFDVDGHEVKVVVELAPPGVARAISGLDPVVTLLVHPKGTQARLIWDGGDFPERVEIKEGDKEDRGHIWVKVPDVPAFKALRVTVYKDGELVAQKETGSRRVRLSFGWDGGDDYNG